VLCDALRPATGARILSIASAGDNVFALAEAGAHVVAVDVSDAQLAMLELKRTAIRTLDYPSLLAFLGVWPSDSRLATYARLADALPAFARAFWDARPQDIRDGIVHAGTLERRFATFRKRVVPLVHDRATVLELLREKDRRARIVFYETRWDSWRWRVMFRLLGSRGAVRQILRRVEYGCTELATHSNPYLNFILTGEFGATLPRYLAPGRFLSLRDAMPRITLVRGPADQAAGMHGPFDGFNLSCIFEYLEPLSYAAMYRNLVDAAKPGARLAYWNLTVPRHRPEGMSDRVDVLMDEANALLARDRAFIYHAFVLEQVR